MMHKNFHQIFQRLHIIVYSIKIEVIIIKLGIKSFGLLLFLFIIVGVSMYNIDGQKEIDAWQNELYEEYKEEPENYIVVNAEIVGKQNSVSIFATGEKL